MRNSYKKSYKVGDKFWWQSFTSTSRSRKVMERFSKKGGVQEGRTPTLFIINIPDKYKVFGLDITKFSQYANEAEVLLSPYTGFRITKIAESNGTVEIHLNVECITPLTSEVIVHWIDSNLDTTNAYTQPGNRVLLRSIMNMKLPGARLLLCDPTKSKPTFLRLRPTSHMWNKVAEYESNIKKFGYYKTVENSMKHVNHRDHRTCNFKFIVSGKLKRQLAAALSQLDFIPSHQVFVYCGNRERNRKFCEEQKYEVGTTPSELTKFLSGDDWTVRNKDCLSCGVEKAHVFAVRRPASMAGEGFLMRSRDVSRPHREMNVDDFLDKPCCLEDFIKFPELYKGIDYKI